MPLEDDVLIADGCTEPAHLNIDAYHLLMRPQNLEVLGCDFAVSRPGPGFLGDVLIGSRVSEELELRDKAILSSVKHVTFDATGFSGGVGQMCRALCIYLFTLLHPCYFTQHSGNIVTVNIRAK